MKNLFTFSFFIFLSAGLIAQNNCSNPLVVSVCPAATLTNQTNAGMGDDGTSGCNIIGEDVVYKLQTPASTQKIFVSVTNVSSAMRVYLERLNCGTGLCNSYYVYSGNNNLTFFVTPASVFYVHIDASITVTYNISFGVDTGTVYINVPNIQGNWGVDTLNNCASPMFKSSMPFFQVTYNTVYKTDPVTFSPLNVPGVLCIAVYLKNTTGIEAAKNFIFAFGNDYGNVTPHNNIPAQYGAGTWTAAFTNYNEVMYTFNDSLGIGQGDFDGNPNTCLKYEFCFDVIPYSNIPANTNIQVTIYSDGFYAGFTGWVRSGCCPSGFGNCFGGMSTSGMASGHAISFGMNDPGGLPIHLLNFEARVEKDVVELIWMTGSEINNDYFTIEKSKDGSAWEEAERIPGAGNSTSNLYYKITDNSPYHGLSYYRLKQTDFDGKVSYSDAKKVYVADDNNILVYPNPASDQITVMASDIEDVQSYICNLVGQQIKLPAKGESGQTIFDTSSLPSGMYWLLNEVDGYVFSKKIVVISR
jgi:hypothetical protein